MVSVNPKSSSTLAVIGSGLVIIITVLTGLASTVLIVYLAFVWVPRTISLACNGLLRLPTTKTPVFELLK